MSTMYKPGTLSHEEEQLWKDLRRISEMRHKEMGHLTTRQMHEKYNMMKAKAQEEREAGKINNSGRHVKGNPHINLDPSDFTYIDALGNKITSPQKSLTGDKKGYDGDDG